MTAARSDRASPRRATEDQAPTPLEISVGRRVSPHRRRTVPPNNESGRARLPAPRDRLTTRRDLPVDHQIYPKPEQLPAALLHVHADLVGRLQQDKRLRTVEQQVAALRQLPGEFVRMDDRIMRAITEVKEATEQAAAVAAEASKPRPIWPAVSAIVAAIALILLVAQPLYGK